MVKKITKKKPKVWIKPDPQGKFRHKVEYNKKGRHPYKRETNLNLDEELLDEVGFIDN